VRRLGEVVAFELRVARNLSVISTAEACALLREQLARLRETGVPGVESLTDLDALKLLRHYELLEAFGAETLRVPHDLIADYLASGPLASSWADFGDRLESTTGEDAWVFAASRVEDRKSFLEVVAAADPILAARCAVQIGPEGIALLEPRLLDAERVDETLAHFNATTAMSILRSHGCLARLRQRLLDEPRESASRHRAVRALALAGDREVLASALGNADLMTSSPLAVSGGDVALVDLARPDVILPLAREALLKPEAASRSFTSIRTIRRFGDVADWEAVEAIAERAGSLAVLFEAVQCLRELDSSRAEQFLRLQLKLAGPENKLDWLEALKCCAMSAVTARAC